MELTGLDKEVRQNTTVVLECAAYQALPEAAITWYNETRMLEPKQMNIEKKTITEVSF
jgi:hypothetical protein